MSSAITVLGYVLFADAILWVVTLLFGKRLEKLNNQFLALGLALCITIFILHLAR